MKTAATFDLLMRLPIMAGLTECQALVLAEAAEKRSFKNKEVLIKAGQTKGNVFIILSGRADVMLQASDTKEVLIVTLVSGDCIGEMSALDHQPHCANVVAAGPLDALMLEPKAFIDVLQNNPQVACTFLKILTKQMARSDRLIRWLITVSVQGRVARTLMDMAITSPDGQLTIKTKLTNVILSKKVSASPELVSKVLKDFRSKAFIEKMPYGELRINDRRKKLRI